ncbi:PolC-type DNA polymerase III [Eubacteriales bacterium OttesenSCG-928-A19]|nr:PolC-type DNA polymerase III [Eubacteriales bacterium OttesenSCG-928-A19]
MNWKTMLPESLASLGEHLELEKVLVDRAGTRMLVCFLSDVLVEEPAYLALRKALQKAFSATRVSLRVCSPALADEVRKDITPFVPFIIDVLARQQPGIRPWLADARWSMEPGGRLVVSICAEAAMRYVRHIEMDRRLTALMWDVFRMEVETAVICEEDVRAQRERLAELEEKAQEAVRQQMQEVERETKKAARTPSPRIYGRPIKDKPVPVGDLKEDSGHVTIRGEIVSVDVRETRDGASRMLTFGITDYTGSITCKAFLRYAKTRRADEEGAAPAVATQADRDRVEAVTSALVEGEWVTVRGDCQFDTYLREAALRVTDIQKADAPKREDKAERKRVELHMHTQMSNMDAVSSATALIRQAAEWGHPAVAVTDHGVVQAFPEAFAAAAKHKIKLIPGMEGYLTDEANVVVDPDGRALDAPIVVLDFETTGLVARKDRVIEIGAVRIRGTEIEDELSLMIDPGIPIPPKITQITEITTAMVRGQPRFEQVVDELMAFIGDCALAAHNASFDLAFLREELARCGRTWQGPVIDTLAFARKAYPALKSHRLGAVCRHTGVKLVNAHRAVHDARATAQILMRMMALAKAKDVGSLKDLNMAFAGGAIGESYHIVLLAKSQDGITNLNRLVSAGHLQHFYRRPNIPRQLLQKHREGLIVGSACAAGELYQAVLDGRDEQTLSRIARFYDYLEIQPLGNNAFLLENGRVESEEELRGINRRIVALGEKLGLPVVATGDVHFLRPEDAKARAILMAGKKFEDADNQPPLYLRTTDDMLEEFAYLGEAKAMEVVVDNPNKIADRVGEVRLFPKHPEGLETFQPYWEDAADTIRDISWGEARRLYGETLPELVEARLNKELGSIIGYGFATLYAIARKLVLKSLDDGYLVGSRGSVGSSFVATMCGITEVNPLPPHYLCPSCRWSHFDTAHELATMGVDLPEKVCPECGTPLKREGFDIPFEVFLGFEGDKVPDIDLNFSGVYQPVAHKYVEELFGEDYVFRAGTIGTLADKTAYGFVKNYLDEREIVATEAEKNRLVRACVGVKRTTGQHPGGIVVLPKGYEIYQFTAIQHPADASDSGIITTHYDFGSMHDVLVKLDILGHDDPTMINMLERLTGVNALGIPLNDEKVMSLFTSPEALGVTPEAIRSTTGTVGIPEFGTRFVRGMLDATKPHTMEELVRISGLSHGTDVWLGNASDLVASGTATLKECICTRDDIMNALMGRGVEPKMAFDTMESVRKGKGLRPDMEEAMRAADTPEWFIDSCKKIKYMFPKGHAVAYVTMALRVAWFKVYYPEAYYAAYYTVRADAFDISMMSRTAAELREVLDDFDVRFKTLTAAEKDQVILAEIALEMHERGVKLLPIDLYASSAETFELVDGAILPPFTAIPGLGLTAAQSLCEARKAGTYMSVEDLKLRSKVSTAVIEQLHASGALGDLPETSQISFF